MARKKKQAKKAPAKTVEEAPVTDDLDSLLDEDETLEDREPEQDEEPEPEPSRGDGRVVLEMPVFSKQRFTTVDRETGEAKVLELVKGINRVPLEDFIPFEKDSFFKKHILGEVVQIVRRPGASLDADGI